jgi:hypothetical protein
LEGKLTIILIYLVVIVITPVMIALLTTNVTLAIPLIPDTQSHENITGMNLTGNNAMHIQLCSIHYPCAKK